MAASVQRAIKIFARIKPTTTSKTANYDIMSSDKNDEEFLTIAVKQNPDDGYINNKPEQHSFRFSKVFDRSILQDRIFLEVAKPVIDSALLGYNGTIFAYGQTGTGKTFTMTGSRSEYEKRGVIPRSLSYIFKRFQEEPDGTKIRAAFVSYLEIYNEGGYDLLHSSDMAGRLEDLGKVTMLEDGHQQMHLRNLSVHPISSEEEALQLLYLGDHNRTVAETPLNEASTRSHCIFTIHLNIREADTSLVRRSKLHLVDLAGSERVSNSPISGQLLTEARHINLALHYLEQVIVALSDTNRQHIPYRNSMMTSVLRDSLGGNCMTSMIATLSMEPRNVMESLSTCRFSQRVAMVTNAAMRNEELDPGLLIQQLKGEVKKLRETIAYSSMTPMTENPEPLSEEEYRDCCTLVDRFLLDPDSNAVLPIIPDMRLVQTCFRLIKSAYTSRKYKMNSLPLNNNNNGSGSVKGSVAGIPPNPNRDRPTSESGASGMSGSVSSQIQLLSRPRTEMTPQELLQTINRRDIEIKVLVEMLRKEKIKRGLCSRESGLLSATINASREKNPNQNCDLSNSLMQPGRGNEIHSSMRNKDKCLADQEDFVEPSSVIDQDSTTEMSEVKKLALGEFLETYDGRGKLEEARTEILKKREEVESLQETITSNEINMGSLSEIYNQTKADGLNKDSENLKNALESQERTYLMQTKRLQAAKAELDEKHEMLKVMYRRLMAEFENWWQNTAKYHPSCDKSGAGTAMQMMTSAFKKPEVETNTFGSTYKINSSPLHILKTTDKLNMDSREDQIGLGREELPSSTMLMAGNPIQYNTPAHLLKPDASLLPICPPSSPWSDAEMNLLYYQNSSNIIDLPVPVPVSNAGLNNPYTAASASSAASTLHIQSPRGISGALSEDPDHPGNQGNFYVEQNKSSSNSGIMYENLDCPQERSTSSYFEEGDRKSLSVVIEDDSMDSASASIPLTGDPVTDNEILKFYKARKKAAFKMHHKVGG